MSGEQKTNLPLPLSPAQAPTALNETEEQILEVFFSDAFQERIKIQLRDSVKVELGKMSELLKESIGNWVIREKKKHDFEGEREKQMALQDRIDTLEAQQLALTMDQETATRQLELKEHENKMLLQGVEKLLHNQL